MFLCEITIILDKPILKNENKKSLSFSTQIYRFFQLKKLHKYTVSNLHKHFVTGSWKIDDASAMPPSMLPTFVIVFSDKPSSPFMSSLGHVTVNSHASRTRQPKNGDFFIKENILISLELKFYYD